MRTRWFYASASALNGLRAPFSRRMVLLRPPASTGGRAPTSWFSSSYPRRRWSGHHLAIAGIAESNALSSELAFVFGVAEQELHTGCGLGLYVDLVGEHRLADLNEREIDPEN